jgi:hypothetical protein
LVGEGICRWVWRILRRLHGLGRLLRTQIWGKTWSMTVKLFTQICTESLLSAWFWV